MAPADNHADEGIRGDIRSASDSGVDHDSVELCTDVPGVDGSALRAISARSDGGVPAANGTHDHTGAVPVRRRSPSGGGDADGNPLRPARGRGDLERPNFDISVGPNGYAWWYVDGLSDCGRRAVSVICFIGSVFSPWYKWSGRRHPQNHVCMNVATYGPGGRFAMTDRGVSALRQSPSEIEISDDEVIRTTKDLIDLVMKKIGKKEA